MSYLKANFYNLNTVKCLQICDTNFEAFAGKKVCVLKIYTNSRTKLALNSKTKRQVI